jgi:hypothetical protein
MIEANLFSKYQLAEPFIDKAVSRVTERGLLLTEITDTINAERKGTKWKPVTIKQVAVKVGHLKEISDLTFLLSICKDSKRRCGSFSKCFYGSLKVK